MFQDVQLSDAGFDGDGDGDDAERALIEVQKKENLIEKSFDKLKETSRVWLYNFIIIRTDIIRIHVYAYMLYEYFLSFSVITMRGIGFVTLVVAGKPLMGC